MKITQIILVLTLLNAHFGIAQTNPAITKWLQNTTIKGRHYVAGNFTPIQDAFLANVQSVKYSATSVYINCTGIPTYIVGPYQDRNPNQAGDNANLYRFPLTPTQNTGTLTTTGGGTIGVFINGVSLFDYRDGVSYNLALGMNQGGPGGGTGDRVWNRDAVVAERVGFDCAKGHPAGTNYHHHQNPSAFKLDRVVISTVCDLYAADGLYVIDSTKHSPLLGFAYDGFPIYGAYAYKNVNGTGGIVRMKSSYSLRNITVRTHYDNMDGVTGLLDVTDGPAVNATYPLGLYREDYRYTPTTSTTPDFLDAHNGRFCVTPDYPNGTYCYFATVDANHNSAYPYVVGPKYYGVFANRRVTAITETVTTYTPTTSVAEASNKNLEVTIFPNPSNDFLAVQAPQAENFDRRVELIGLDGKILQTNTLYQGSTITYLDIRAVYAGIYMVKISAGQSVNTIKVVISN
jgi:YHYH protein/Secretion system C-terminal sorting domain